jgi:predicted nuclease of predicted toxin-antitoxin system
MRLLLDTCVWGKSVDEIRAAGHDVVWAGDWAEDPGDAEILGRAVAEGRVLVTLDKDFGTLAIARGMQHCGLVRIVDIAGRRQGSVILYVLQHYGDELGAGAVVTVSPGRVRIRPPDPDVNGPTS